MPALISRRKTIGGRDGFVDESPASSIQETNDNSMDSLHLTQDYIGFVSLTLRRKLTDIMFVYDLINYNIVCSELLSEISFRIPYLITRNSDLFLSTTSPRLPPPRDFDGSDIKRRELSVVKLNDLNEESAPQQ
ncbi:hypothetical protein QTP88_028669 [Uroleucon formosanum]